MTERTITVASVVKDDYEGKVSWNVETTERIGMVKCWSFPPGPEIAEYLGAHLMEPITVTVSEKDKTSKAGKPYKQISVLGIPGVIEPAKSPQNGSQGQGKGSWRESWNQSEEGQRFQHDQMNRRTALMTAKDLTVAGSVADGVALFTLADGFYAWLTIRDGSGSASHPPSPGASRPEHSGEPKETLANGEGVGGSKAPDGSGVSTNAPDPQSLEAVEAHGAATPSGAPASDSSDGAVNEPRGRTSSDAPSDPLQPKRDKAVELHGSERNLLFEAARFYKKSLSLGQLSEGQLDELIATREKSGALT